MKKQTSLADVFTEALSKQGLKDASAICGIHPLIQRAAEGDLMAIRSLIHLGSDIAKTIESALRQFPDVQDIARSAFRFPVCLSAKEEDANETLRYVREEVGIGRNFGERSRRKPGRKPGLGAALAGELFEIIEQKRNLGRFYPSPLYPKRWEGLSDDDAAVCLHLWICNLPAWRESENSETEVDRKAIDEWANAGAHLMVDGCKHVQGVPKIPAEWKKRARCAFLRRKKKEAEDRVTPATSGKSKAKPENYIDEIPKGELREIVRKNLVAGFLSISSS
jgi:hypothetical protein